MKIGHLYLFQYVRGNGTVTRDWMIAAWHNPRSLTWRWVLSWYSFNESCRRGVSFLRLNTGWMWVANIPCVGHFHLQTQYSVWR